MVDAAVLLREACDRYPEGLELTEQIHALAQRGDALRARLGERIERALMTPVDGRDLHALAMLVDAICDRVDDVADELVLYRPAALPEQARAQARVLMLACERVADAVIRLPRLPDLGAELDDVRRLEEEGDRLRRDATAALFGSGLDAIEIVRLKSIHESLERAIDACRAVADLLAIVALKHRW